MGLEARDAVPPHAGVMADPGGQLEAIAAGELLRFAHRRQPERDRARFDDDHLVVAMLVGVVSIARTVGPAGRVGALGEEAVGIAPVARHGAIVAG